LGLEVLLDLVDDMADLIVDASARSILDKQKVRSILFLIVGTYILDRNDHIPLLKIFQMHMPFFTPTDKSSVAQY
jgi:hypothetical protein